VGERYIGMRVARVEDPRLLQGHGRYVDDIHLPGMLEVAFVRAAHAHALVKGIEKSHAAALPGVYAIWRLADFGDSYTKKRMAVTAPSPLIKQTITQFPLAQDEVCYVGEPIALVLAENRYVAEDAAALVEVEYEPLPAIVDSTAALDQQAARAHKDSPDNLVGRVRAGFGDAASAFKSAAHIVKETVRQHRGGSHSIECRGVVASFDASLDQLTLWIATQSPYAARKFIAGYLGRDEHHVRVMAPDVGGGFGPKAVVYPEDIATALAAVKCGRPVKWIEDRREHFYATTQQRDQVWQLEVAADAQGKILGIRGHAVHDNGAYTPYGLLLPMTSLSPFPGPYALPSLEIAMDVVFTNTMPTTPVRGAGRPNAAFVLERLVDRVAEEVGIDRAEARRRNFIRPDQFPYATGAKGRDGSPVMYDSGNYPATLEKALALAAAADFPARQAAARAEGRYLGLGISSCTEDTGIGPFEGATVRVSREGKVAVLTGAAAQGQGLHTVLAQITADTLGVDLANVTVRSADTGMFPLGLGTVASRVAVTAGSSVHLAAERTRAKALKLAATLLEVGEQDLVIERGVVHPTGVPDMKVTLGELASRLAGDMGAPVPAGLEPSLEATAYHNARQPVYANGCQVVEVEVDVETGAVKILRYAVAHDCGRLLNPMLVDGQIIGGVVHGIGNALYERMAYDESGQPITTNLAEYLMPLASEMPRIEIAHHETLSPSNPLGIKGAGEGGTIPAPAAVIAAVEDALQPFGVRIAEYPLSPERIVTLIAAARTH
jgi:carbon-monoxide dehydrogenase large subunit